MNILSISGDSSRKPTDQLFLSSGRIDLRLRSAFQEPLAKTKSISCFKNKAYMRMLERKSTMFMKYGITDSRS